MTNRDGRGATTNQQALYGSGSHCHGLCGWPDCASCPPRGYLLEREGVTGGIRNAPINLKHGRSLGRAGTQQGICVQITSGDCGTGKRSAILQLVHMMSDREAIRRSTSRKKALLGVGNPRHASRQTRVSLHLILPYHWLKNICFPVISAAVDGSDGRRT